MFGATSMSQKDSMEGKVESKQEKNAHVSKQKGSVDMAETKLQIVRTIETTDHNYMETQHKKTINQKQKVQKKIKKVIVPQTTSIFLRYNKLVSIQNFNQFIQPIFPNPNKNLMWIDLSHNRLTELSSDLS